MLFRFGILVADFHAKGIGAGEELPENVITAYVGNGQLPLGLVCNVDTVNARRLLFCALGAARGIHDDRLAVLGKESDPCSVAHAVLEARLGMATKQLPTMATCVVDVSEQHSSSR